MHWYEIHSTFLHSSFLTMKFPYTYISIHSYFWHYFFQHLKFYSLNFLSCTFPTFNFLALKFLDTRSFLPRGMNLFLTVLSLWWSRPFGPRGTSLSSLVVGALFEWSRCFRLQGKFIFYSAFLFFPFWWELSLSEVVVFNLEGDLFLAVLSFWWSRFLDPEARI